MAIDEKLSKLVANQFPDFYKEEGENFLAFMEAYYEYMEQQGKLTHEIRNLQSYRDISTTTDEFLSYLQRDLMPSIPAEIVANKKIFAKHVKDFNETRGTLSSYKLLFRIIYNEDIELHYPADQILKVSDGDWRIDRYLVCSYDPKTYTFIGKTIKGTSSQAEALVEDVVRRMIRGRDLMQILVSNVRGTFNNLEQVRLKSDTNGTGHTPIVEAGINRVEVTTPGGEYRIGDVVRLISDTAGEFGKVVVTDTVDLGGTLTFSIVNRGSGYTPSTSAQDGTSIELIGGDGSTPASFEIDALNLADTYAISINTNFISSNNIFGALGPAIVNDDGVPRQMSTFANTIISATRYGFPESGESVGNAGYRDHADAWITIANTSDPNITVGSSLFGATSGANATVTSVIRAYSNNNVVLRIDGYKNFNSAEKVNIVQATGTTVGTVSKFEANTVGWHPVQVAVISGRELSVGDEVRGRVSGAHGIVRHVGTANTGAYTAPSTVVRDVITYRIGANTTANTTSQFETGPMRSFLANESVALLTSNTTVGNVIYTSANTIVENVHTKLQDSLIFKATVFGSIATLSSVVGGAGYSIAPTVRVREYDVAALGIGESILTLQSSNAELLQIDSTDRIVQSAVSGDVKHTNGRVTHSNGIYQVSAKVWQPFGQREPGNVFFANNTTATLQRIVGDYTPGYESDTRPVSNTMIVKIVSVEDRGVLGKNANIRANVGANGAITSIRVLDSGFSYRQGEGVVLEATNRNLATGATGAISLTGVANAEGYYATSRSQVSTTRGYIQDGTYYQEFSYEIISPVALERYRDFALHLAHPAGQALFGKYRIQSNAAVTTTATTSNMKRVQSNGTITINNGSFNIVGTGTAFTAEFANNDSIFIEYAPKQFYKMPLNIVSSATSANVKVAWANTNLSSANAYYITGSM